MSQLTFSKLVLLKLSCPSDKFKTFQTFSQNNFVDWSESFELFTKLSLTNFDEKIIIHLSSNKSKLSLTHTGSSNQAILHFLSHVEKNINVMKLKILTFEVMIAYNFY